VVAAINAVDASVVGLMEIEKARTWRSSVTSTPTATPPTRRASDGGGESMVEGTWDG
jgi:hypothetical protein